MIIIEQEKIVLNRYPTYCGSPLLLLSSKLYISLKLYILLLSNGGFMERSKKIVFISHCLLNQNVRPLGTEKYPGIVKELMDLFSEAGVGLVQMPCPEFELDGGFSRKPKSLEKLDTKAYRKGCRELAKKALGQIDMYKQKSYNVLGILGVEFSPSCGVHQIENGSKNVPGKGIFIEELEDEMNKRNFQIPIIGMNLNNLFSSMEKLKDLIKYS